MRSKAIELFLALGLAATITACGGAANDGGGEGGEGDEEGASPQPTQTQPSNGGGEGGES